MSYCSTHLDCSLIVHKECHFKVELPCPKSKVSKMCLYVDWYFLLFYFLFFIFRIDPDRLSSISKF